MDAVGLRVNINIAESIIFILKRGARATLAFFYGHSLIRHMVIVISSRVKVAF